MPELVIGTAQLGLNYGKTNITGKPTHELSKEIINYALDNKIRIIRISSHFPFSCSYCIAYS